MKRKWLSPNVRTLFIISVVIATYRNNALRGVPVEIKKIYVNKKIVLDTETLKKKPLSEQISQNAYDATVMKKQKK